MVGLQGRDLELGGRHQPLHQTLGKHIVRMLLLPSSISMRRRPSNPRQQPQTTQKLPVHKPNPK